MEIPYLLIPNTGKGKRAFTGVLCKLSPLKGCFPLWVFKLQVGIEKQAEVRPGELKQGHL